MNDLQPIVTATIARLPGDEQATVWQRAHWCDRVSNLPHGKKGAECRLAEQALGITQSAFAGWLRKWEAAETYSDAVAAMVSRRRILQPVALPPLFLDFWAKHRAKYQRATGGSQAHKALVRRWQQWARNPYTTDTDLIIPGYDAPPPPAPRTGLPAGWTLGNLYDYTARAYAKTAAARGRKAASELTPNIRTSRKTLLPGQMLEWDDMESDQHILFPGQPTPVRPVGFGICDRASDYVPWYWWKARQRKDAVYTKLTDEDFFWFALGYLTKVGVRRDTGSTLIGEHGTACFKGELKEGLRKVYGDKIGFAVSGLSGAPLRGLAQEDSGGNPRFKARIEGMHGILHNALCHLPGAVGRNYQLKPADLTANDREAVALLKLMDGHHLSEERKALLMLPYLTYQQFTAVCAEHLGYIMADRDHACAEWEESGFVQMRYNWGGRWIGQSEFLALPEMGRQQVIMAANSGLPGWVECQRMSRAEAWGAHVTPAAMRRLLAHEVAMIVPEHLRRTVRIDEDTSIRVRDVDKFGTVDALVYSNICRAQNGHQMVLDRGQKYQAVLNPQDAQWLHILTDEGGYLGSCPMQLTVTPGDADSLRAAFRQHGEAVGHEIAEAHNVVSQRAVDRDFRRQWNDRVKATDKPLTAAEHHAAALSARATAAMLSAAHNEPAGEEPEHDDERLERLLTSVGAD